MATEKRLIDVTEPLKLFRGWIKQLELPEDAGDKRGVESCIGILEDEPTVDAVEVVFCDYCVKHGGCYTEDVFRLARIEKPYCCAGKRDGDGNG